MKAALKAFILLSTVYTTYSQNDYNDMYPCGFHYLNKNKNVSIPAYDFDTTDIAQADSFVIPVVVHIFHSYGSGNISDQQVRDGLRIINEDYNCQNPEMNLILDEFKEVIGNPRITFRLARTDPEGKPTNGIVRIPIEETEQANDLIKLKSTWDQTKYMNIWIAKNPKSDKTPVAGYAYYPCYWATPIFDGLFIKSSLFGSIGTASLNGQIKTPSHEIGHYLGLWHPWAKGTTMPGLVENCNDDDAINDTPNEIGCVMCDLKHSSCGSLDNAQNFMGYFIEHQGMFTKGQVLKIRYILNQKECNNRNNLWQDSNLVATGTYGANYSVYAMGVPKADFYSKKIICSDTYLGFYPILSNTDSIDQINYKWTVEGPETFTSTEKMPYFHFYKQGKYSVSLVVANKYGKDSIYKTENLEVMPNTSKFTTPLDFDIIEPLIYNINSSDDWVLNTNLITNVYLSDKNQYNNKKSIMIDAFNIENEFETQIISPQIFLNQTDTSILFDISYAYAEKSEASATSLYFSISNNCGESWKDFYSITSKHLSTVNTYKEESFYPTVDQWEKLVYPIPSSYYGQNIKLKVRIVSLNGNNFFLSNIKVYKDGTLSYKNEHTEHINYLGQGDTETIRIENLDDRHHSFILRVYSITGNQMSQESISIEPGINAYQIEVPSPGVYIIDLKSKELRIRKRFIKIN